MYSYPSVSYSRRKYQNLRDTLHSPEDATIKQELVRVSCIAAPVEVFASTSDCKPVAAVTEGTLNSFPRFGCQARTAVSISLGVSLKIVIWVVVPAVCSDNSFACRTALSSARFSREGDLGLAGSSVGC